MWQDIKAVYREGLRAATLFPLLFLIPAVVEFSQHVVELNAGMYLSLAGAKAAEHDSLRTIFGFAKTLALLLPGYWFVRAMAFADRAKATRIEQPAFGLWLILLALNAALLAYSLFGPPLGTVFGLSGTAGRWAGPAVSAVWALFGIYLTAWFVAWPLGNREIGPLQSVKVMTGSFWRTLGYTVACVLPLMTVHYGLGYAAIKFTPTWLDWPVLVFDALVVALLACTMAGSSLVAARHATRRKSVALTGTAL
jgi:hypothetical protein